MENFHDMFWSMGVVLRSLQADQADTKLSNLIKHLQQMASL